MLICGLFSISIAEHTMKKIITRVFYWSKHNPHYILCKAAKLSFALLRNVIIDKRDNEHSNTTMQTKFVREMVTGKCLFSFIGLIS